MGELSEIIKFNREVSADVNLYFKKHLKNKNQKIKYNSIYWGKIRDIIVDANSKA